MKRSTLIKLAFVMMAIFSFTEMNAQILTDYAQDNATAMYQTAGRSFRLYVMPDLVYSPGYIASANAPIGANARWRFVYAGLSGSPLTNTTQANNYVEFTAPAVGVYTVDAYESNSVIGCEDGTPQTQTINVVAAPSAGFTTADATAFCGDQLAQAINISFTEDVPDAMAAFAFAVTEVVDEIDGADVLITNVSTNNTYKTFPLSGKAKSGTAGFTAATPDFDYDFTSSVLAVSNSHRTRYTYTLVKATDAGAYSNNGVISAISQKSGYGNYDLLGSVSYNYTDNSVVFIVNPTPTTGPIYHVSNAFNY